MLKYLIFFIFLVCANIVFAQQPASIHLTEKDGLPDIEFYNIIEDSNAFIWLASNKGLYRYDGQDYKYYSHPKQHGNAVFGNLEDNKGRVWINNISGQFFYVKNENLELFIDLGEQLNGQLVDFKVTETHLLVFNGINIYTVALRDKIVNKVFNKEYSYIGLPLEYKGNYYYTQKNEIIKTNHLLKKIDSLNIDVFSNYTNDSGISKRVNLVSNGNLFFCHFRKFDNNVMYQFNIDKKWYNRIEVPGKLRSRSINQVFFKDNDIWVATDLGIQVYKLKDNKLELKRHLFKKKNVTKIIVDSNKNYWITTKGDGIYVIPNINIFQYNIPEDIININKLKKINNNTVLFGTNNGRIATLNINSSKVNVLDSSSVYRVTDILVDSNRNEAVIIKEDKAFKYQFRTNRLKLLNKPLLFGAKNLSQIDSVTTILSSYKDAFLLGDNFEDKGRLINKRSYTNYYSQTTKSIYVGSVEGLFVFDKNLNKSQLRYNNKPILAVSISETKDGTIWVSTFNNGVLGIKDGNIEAHYNINNGLLSNKVGHIKANKDHLWITTEKGVQLLDVRTKTLKNLTKQNGIPSYRISDIEIIDNQVFFASNIGLFGINMDSVFRPLKQKEIYFTEVFVNDGKRVIEDLHTLDYNENKIEFNFNVNGFQSNVNTRYQYRLLKTDTIWKTTNELVNSASYNSLSSGKYIFQVKVLSEEETLKSIQFLILKPFWNRWWFYVLLAILISFSIYAIFVSKIKKLKRTQTEILQKELLNKQLVFSQLENLRSQMNPHFIFNALNSIQEYIVFNEKDLASSYLIKFSRLIRIYLDHSRENEVLLIEEIDALKIYLELEKNRFEDLLTYKINIAEELKNNKIKIPSLFIQPYIENALKHGLLHKKEDRRLVADFYLNSTKTTLHCSIKDNGIGIEASRKLNQNRNPMHKSFATSANEKRVHLLNSNRKEKIKVETISLANGHENGTEVLITIPL